MLVVSVEEGVVVESDMMELQEVIDGEESSSW